MAGVENPSEQLAAVLGLAKSARATVGFLPDSAFRERADSGTLIAATVDGQVVGYALYDLPRDEVKIVQLVVRSAQRRSGIARALIEAVCARHPSRRGIALSCRNDFPAHGMWPSLGFVPRGERVGRSLEGKPLTRWWRSFGQPDLLTLLEASDTRPTAVLDSCVFFDAILDEPPGDVVQLRADWIGDHVRLAISGEVLVEISDDKDAARRERQYRAAQNVPLVDPPESLWKPIETELSAGSTHTDTSDVRQVARALAAGGQWLVTSDTALRNRYAGRAEALGGLSIVSPAEFVRQVDEAARGDWYSPVDLAQTAVTIREVNAAGLGQLAARFVNHQAGEEIGDLSRVVQDAAARPKEISLRVVEVDGASRALLATHESAGVLHVGLLRVAAGRGERVLGRQLLGLLRSEAQARGVEVVRVADPFVSEVVRQSFADEGYVARGTGALAIVLTGLGTMGDLVKRVDDLRLEAQVAGVLSTLLDGSDAAAAARAELWFAPFRVIGAGIPTFVVPIRSGWATDLFDVGLASGQLLPRSWELGLRRELIYYRSPRNSGGLRAPARILWYVSGSANEPGSRSVRAVSSLTEVVTAPTSHLWHRFRRLGVYQESDIVKSASDGRAMALRFASTELLDHPVGLDDYREVLTGDRKSKSLPMPSPQPISEHAFVELLSRGRFRGE